MIKTRRAPEFDHLYWSDAYSATDEEFPGLMGAGISSWEAIKNLKNQIEFLNKSQRVLPKLGKLELVSISH